MVHPETVDPGPVYVNEVLTHTDPPEEDAIELYNPNEIPVDISGWYLTDSKADPMKFRIPDGTTIDAGKYKVFYSRDFNDSTLPYPFNLSENGEEVYLYADSTGSRNGGFCHGFSFDAIDNGATFGRYICSTGEERFVTQSIPTLGRANAGPVFNSIVITEIMYNPQNGRDEYIEIKNITTETVLLFDPENPENTWKIKGFDFSFPLDVSLSGGEVAVITTDTITAAQFRSLYNVPSEVKIFNSATGKLRNGSDTITLMAPMKPNLDSTEIRLSFKVIEDVAYSDGGLWPALADGSGSALVRRDLYLYANDPGNWTAAPPSPGRETR